MSVANVLPGKQPTTKKPILQQSNYNFDTTPEKDDNCKEYLLKNRRDAKAQEAENQFSPKTRKSESKAVKSDVTKKLRNMHLELSSLKKRALIVQRANSLMNKSETEFSSDESSEEELKKKRRVRPVVPNYVTNSDSGPCRKPRQSRQDPAVLSSQNSAKMLKAQPLSIARRNARERNRVKQVNEGFATLRNRIPDYISEAYNEEKGRKSAKKLSKVETLRMAVDYIRHLENLLDVRTVENDAWLKEVKSESQQPWTTPNSFADYPSSVESKFQNSSPPPVGYYDQNFEYQERIFYDYDLDFLEKKDNFLADEKSGQGNGQHVENHCVENFKFYESFDRLERKDNSEGREDDNHLDEDSRESENLILSEVEPEIDRIPSPKSNDLVNKTLEKTLLPSVNDSFNKSIPAFF